MQRRLIIAVVLGVVAAVATWGAAELQLRQQILEEAERLASISAEAAAGIDAAAHERIQEPEDVDGPDFVAIRQHLREVADRYQLTSPVYTLRPVDTDTGDRGTIFVVMTNATPFFGHGYRLTPEMVPVVRDAERAMTGLYRSPNGWWISGLAPVRDARGETVAVVSCDRPSGDLVLARARGVLLAGFSGLVWGLLVWLVTGALLAPTRQGRRLADLFVGRLSTRIGLAGAGTLVLTVLLLGVLGHLRDKALVVDGLEERLGAVVQVGALQLDPAVHARVAASLRDDTDDFEALRQSLREIQEAADLPTPLYTLVRDGERTRFVGMTQETPFVGDVYDLRPGVRQTFETGVPGVEGPYSDAHGRWVSAWAPVKDAQGDVIAVLQADLPVDDVDMQLGNRDLERLVAGLVAVLTGFFVWSFIARSIARPVAEVARATERIQQGDYAVALAEDRADEVGELMRATNRMARGLKERELLRTMFGKYMATQVASELLATGQVELSGEEREVSVLISDIRGYTALTEELSAAEVVALLNEYFGILVEVVMEHDGVIDKFMGDALLCWFGAPVPRDDHRSAAVSAALAIQERTAAWNQARVAQGKRPVATGIGIADGEVVVGNIGSSERLEYTAIGDAVNLASRLCSQAGAGEVVVTRRVWSDAGEAATGFDDGGAIAVKGVREPVDVRRWVTAVVAA